MEAIERFIIVGACARDSAALRKIRPSLEGAFPGIPWLRRSQLTSSADKALYFLETDFGSSETVEVFEETYGKLASDVARRVVLDKGNRGGSWHILSKYGMAGAVGIEYDFIGRSDIYQRILAGTPMTGQFDSDGRLLYPGYTWFPDIDQHIADYVRELDPILSS